VSFSRMVLEVKTRIIKKKELKEDGTRRWNTDLIVIPARMVADSEYPFRGHDKTFPVHIEIKDDRLLVTQEKE
jgi:hypothetical protein